MVCVIGRLRYVAIKIYKIVIHSHLRIHLLTVPVEIPRLLAMARMDWPLSRIPTMGPRKPIFLSLIACLAAAAKPCRSTSSECAIVEGET